MNRRAVLVAAALVLAGCRDVNPPTSPATLDLSPATQLDTNVIFVLRPEFAPGGQTANQARAADIARALGLTPAYSYGTAMFGFAASVPKGRLVALAKDPRVQSVSADGEVMAVGQTLPTGVDRIQADVSSTLAGNGGGSVNVSIAILDTGIDLNHPDLNVASEGKNCSTGRSFDDGNGHGTHVSGTVGARDNGFGVVGVAPGALLYAVRVLNSAGSGTWSSLACGIDWVTANTTRLNIKLANMSLVGTGADDGNCGKSNNDALHQAICNSVSKGITYIAAAGNSNADIAGFVPASYDEVLTVTAVADFDGKPGGLAEATCRADDDDTAADFSNFTTPASNDAGHTIAAPGVCIRSTWKAGGYNTVSGTSMAAPHVTGAAALCLAANKCSGAPSSVIAKLRADAAGQGANYGFIGDPYNPIRTGGPRGQTLYYGYLLYAGRY
jgi:subtilisin family serine protease